MQNIILKTRIYFFLILILCLPAIAKSSDLKNRSISFCELRCEGFVNPITIDQTNPQLSWNVTTLQRNWMQSAYQIIVASTPANLKNNKGDLWNSGKIRSDKSIAISYKGKTLQSFKTYYWKVKVWDNDGQASQWSNAAYWKMAMLNKKDWKGDWISSDMKLTPEQLKLQALPDFDRKSESNITKWAAEIRKQKQYDTATAVYIRKEIKLQPKKVLRATAYVCGLGLHELYINGQRIGNQYLNPAFTDYQKTVLYNTYDVTKNVKAGKNAIGVILGNGWYNLIVPHLLFYYTADYIAPPKLLMQLLVEYSDGTTATFSSDKTWKFTRNGPIIYNGLLNGETYDARKELGNWSTVGYADKQWQFCNLTHKPDGTLKAQQLDPVKIIANYKPVKLTQTKEGFRFDFGKELCGWAKIKLRGKSGQKIKISYPGSGTHTLGRYQTHYYILKGEGVEVYQPRFSYNGFRYVDIEGLNYTPELTDAEGEVVNTDLEHTGKFTCSNDTLNRIQSILIVTIQNFIIHIPADPTREKSGWTQDIQSGFDVNAYNFNVANMYKKWEHDLTDIMYTDGYVPPVAPGRFDGYFINGPWWGGMVVYNTAKIFDYYGDTAMVKNSYPHMKRYVNYLSGIAENNIVKWGLGEWLEPFRKGKGALPTTTPVPLTSTIAYYHYVQCMARFAAMLNYKDDARAYTKLAENIKISYNKEFFNAATGQYALGSQAGQIMSLKYGLVPPDKTAIVIKRLKGLIAAHNGNLSTGFVATPVLLTTLSDFNMGEAAYTMATKKDFPGWYDMIFGKGNTVMKENWEGGLVQMPSLGGPIGHWFYYSLAGIKPMDGSVGFKNIVIKPDLLKELTHVSASCKMPYGLIASEWKYEAGKYYFNIEIPANTSALVYLPSANVKDISEGDKMLTVSGDIRLLKSTANESLVKIGSGKYHFQVIADKRP